MYDLKSLDEFYNGTNRTRTVWVVCPWIRKFAIFDYVYSLASANLDQSVPNLATIYIPMKSGMSSIMGQIESEHLEKLLNRLWLHSRIYKYWPVSTKLGQNVCDHKISDEFDYGSNRTRTVWVICPWTRKFAIFDFVYTLASAILTNQYQTWPKYIYP